MPTNLSARTIVDLYREASSVYSDLPAFARKVNKTDYKSINFKELYESGLNLATALIDLGMKQAEHVGLISDNRLEWIIADCGILLAGGADVPRGSDVTDKDIAYIFPHADVEIVFVENDSVLEKIEKNRSSLQNIKHVILMDETAEGHEGILRIYDLIEKGKILRDAGDRRAEERMSQVTPEDLFTVIYTSGTTGTPKGVMLTHANMISQVENLPIHVGKNDRCLSILPVWHIYERIFQMLSVGYGFCTYYTNIRSIKEDMKIVKPTIMGSAPRLWESVYIGIQKNIKLSSPTVQKLFNIAYFCSRNFKSSIRFLTFQELDLTGRSIFYSIMRGFFEVIRFSVFLIPDLLLDAVVLRKIRAATGGKLRLTVSGGGALQPHVDHFFNNIGIRVLEGYGLTETSPVLAVRREKFCVIGTVGPVWPHTEIRIVDINSGKIIFPPERGVKGELHVKGPQVMKGYNKNPEDTAKVLNDGWLNTGDIGMITFNNCLKIMGRSKETIVLLGGENVEPVPIENIITGLPMVEHCMVVGQDQKTLSVLVVPSADYFKEVSSNLSELSKNEGVRKTVLDAIKSAVSTETGFKSFEKIQDCRILPKNFEAGDELSGKLSVKRHVVTEKYQYLIDEMYR